MPTRNDEEFERLSAEVARRQKKRPPGPKPIAEVLSRLMSRRGYAQIQAPEEWKSIWCQTVGAKLAAQSRVARVRGGLLEVLVRNSATLQELTFQKKAVLAYLQKTLPDNVIRDVRFRVGELDE